MNRGDASKGTSTGTAQAQAQGTSTSTREKEVFFVSRQTNVSSPIAKKHCACVCSCASSYLTRLNLLVLKAYADVYACVVLVNQPLGLVPCWLLQLMFLHSKILFLSFIESNGYLTRTCPSNIFT